jgi:hypothetical protein
LWAARGQGQAKAAFAGGAQPVQPGLPGGIPCGGGVKTGGAILLNGGTSFFVDRYTYVSQKYDVWFDAQWASLGYLALFIVAFQLMALYGINRVRHIVR